MINIEQQLKQEISKVLAVIFKQSVNESHIQIQKTRTDFEGDFTLVVFPFVRIAKMNPELLAKQIGDYLIEHSIILDKFNVVKGFLNLSLADGFWLDILKRISKDSQFGIVSTRDDARKIMIEYSSPNTNKPLHLGHIRNNLLGFSVARILEACGHKIVKVNLVNDRGIHICKSMLAWQKWGNGITPEKAKMKGDKLVGDFYVKFDQEYKKEIVQLVNEGMSEDEAKEKAPLIKEAREMLIRWENRDAEVLSMWEMMNKWVYDGFDVTYKRLGIEFDKIYYESNTYKQGRSIVLENLEKGLLIQKDDNSVWADLTSDKLDEKILLRSDGTSVYMTQDLGTAVQRFEEYDIDEHVYVVGNEQDYHFKVLALVLQKMGYEWASRIFHLSYGMVELPSGKMKSREGTVVDADDLIDTMVKTAAAVAAESGKLDNLTVDQVEEIHNMVGLGALKYFILKVDPKKNMLFNPEESIDFNGNTGPFIQYTHARIKSLLRNVLGNQQIPSISDNILLEPKEKELIKTLSQFPLVLEDAGQNMNPGAVANYLYDLVKVFNQFYHVHSVANEVDLQKKNLRICLAHETGIVIKRGMWMLGIDVPEQM